MTPKEFKATVDDAVANGANRKDAEDYVRSGFKLDDDAFKLSKPPAKKKAPAKKRAPAKEAARKK